VRSNKPEFGKIAAYCIDGLGPLAHHKIANAKHNRFSLLRFALHLYEPHSRPLRCFADRFGVSCIVLLPFDEGLDVSRRDQSDVMPHLHNLSSPVMAASTRFHGHRTSRLTGEEPKNASLPIRLTPTPASASVGAREMLQ
jgi:hypothetical protein